MVRNCRCHRLPAGASDGRSVETFLWDGLALIRRDGTNFVNEPAVTGGNPVIAGDKTLFNDMLGSTLGAKTGGEFSVIERDAFGQTETASDYDFFTGKSHIGELGYAFLFRNYRANLGKWQTADPMGYPDGWNNLAYVNNNVTGVLDPLGLKTVVSDGIEYSWDWSTAKITGTNFISNDMEAGRQGTQVWVTWTVEISWKCIRHPETCTEGGTFSGSHDVLVSNVPWNKLSVSVDVTSTWQGYLGEKLAKEVAGFLPGYVAITKEGLNHILTSRPSANANIQNMKPVDHVCE
ncbi:MAG: hypothetical protein HPZ91_06770 [Lentisphaeria bacterium]|nr:hypothetical protein [Lentisphaeria bacterium]